MSLEALRLETIGSVINARGGQDRYANPADLAAVLAGELKDVPEGELRQAAELKLSDPARFAHFLKADAPPAADPVQRMTEQLRKSVHQGRSNSDGSLAPGLAGNYGK